MEAKNWLFLLLCAGEIVVILAGQISVPAAVILQLIIPLALLRGFLGTVRTYLSISVVCVLFTLLFAVLLLFERHTLIPLLILAVLALLAIFALTITRYRIERRYGGRA
jgi:hypothetical protein